MEIWTSFMKEKMLDLYNPSLSYDLKNTQIGPRPDIVVLKLRNKFTLDEFVAPACLPTRPITTESNCFVSGWGNTRPTSFVDQIFDNATTVSSIVLQAAKLKILDLDECEKVQYDFLEKIKTDFPEFREHWWPFLKHYEICYASGEKSACSGDSGGPLVCRGIHLLYNSQSIRPIGKN